MLAPVSKQVILAQNLSSLDHVYWKETDLCR